MEWITELFTQQTFTQAVLVLALISATGLALGSIKMLGASLGVTFVFFAGIVAGHFGVTINPEMLALAQNFGLILYIYSLGVQVGPGFFSSFKQGGVKLNLIALLLLLTGTLTAMIFHWTAGLSVPDTVGLLAGAVTNTPMLGAAQQALLQIHPDDVEAANSMAIACAVSYPCGIAGMILAVIILKKFLAPKTPRNTQDTASDNTFVAEYQISNPAVFGKSIKDVRHNADCQFVISRVWKDGKVIIPTSETVLEKDEHILVISGKKDVERIKILFGQKENVDWNKEGIDWNSIDNQLISRKILVTKSEYNGIKLGSLRLRNSYGINITRVNRAGIDLLPSRSLRLQLGDKLTIVGESRAVENVAALMGNKAKELRNPNLLSIFIGIVLGLVLGSIPIALPGMSTPVKLGIAGGPIIVGILMGAFGPRFHIATYTTRSANLMLRQLGLTIYLAGLGLSAGSGFFETVFTWQGLKWVAISLSIAIVPVLLVGFISQKVFRTGYTDNAGMLCGSMANPFALEFAQTDTEGEDPAVAYATVYPASIFLRVISAQIIVLLLG
ncbi:MAG: putative transporter [Bacteroidales bacterium]|nr:putative transporter [Bacteroidales bacterium]